MKKVFTLVLLSSMVALAACSEKKAEATVDSTAAVVDSAAAVVDSVVADSAAADSTK
jgi:uncharacterized protein YcfL